MTSILGFADILRSGEVSPATRRTARAHRPAAVPEHV